MQTTEVTQSQWQSVMGNNPSYFGNCGGNCPVESVSWNDAQTFIDRLNQRDNKITYRLPTEAEWEYSARAGSTGRFCFGNDYWRLSEYAWYGAKSGNRTHPVVQLKANRWGLYDMHGNVWEWCQDWYGDYSSISVDPMGPSTGGYRVSRGGGWFNLAGDCRPAFRFKDSPVNRNRNLGFRLAGQ